MSMGYLCENPAPRDRSGAVCGRSAQGEGLAVNLLVIGGYGILTAGRVGLAPCAIWPRWGGGHRQSRICRDRTTWALRNVRAIGALALGANPTVHCSLHE